MLAGGLLVQHNAEFVARAASLAQLLQRLAPATARARDLLALPDRRPSLTWPFPSLT